VLRVHRRAAQRMHRRRRGHDVAKSTTRNRDGVGVDGAARAHDGDQIGIGCGAEREEEYPCLRAPSDAAEDEEVEVLDSDEALYLGGGVGRNGFDVRLAAGAGAM
jgi:hypothetical protein